MISIPPWFPLRGLAGMAALLALTSCATSTAGAGAGSPAPRPAQAAAPPTPDPRIGLRPGLFTAGEALWNMRLVSTTPPPREFVGGINSDLAFTGHYVIQGNFRGFQIWDISTPSRPVLVRGYVCPASQSDVSVYRHLLFVSGEGFEGRLDCGTQPPREAVSPDRLRGIRIFDISDIRNPRYIANVQTCRGSHTHTVVEDPNDPAHVYLYVSGSAPVRPEAELPGCTRGPVEENPNTAEFRIEVIRVPLAQPERAEIVSSPRIFAGLREPPRRLGMAPEDRAALEQARARGQFVVEVMGQHITLPAQMTRPMLDSIVRARGGTGAPTAADSAALRAVLPGMLLRMIGTQDARPTQCHDITVFPAVGLAGGACEGYGLLLDIRDPANPKRLAAVADSNFAYWHSATFNNDGTKVLFTDEWGGGTAPKCRATDPKEWGANALFSIENGQQLRFRSYYKLPAPQTSLENCVAHNGSLIPIPGRDVMVQGWYQGGISVFDWTDPDQPREIAFFDRGPVDSTRMETAGSWSVYWYNGLIVSSEIARGLDILELTPSAFLSENEIAAANTVRLDYLNAQGQPKFVWPPSLVLARAYVDQLERSGGLSPARIAAIRADLNQAERATGTARREILGRLAAALDLDAATSPDGAKVRLLLGTVRALANAP